MLSSGVREDGALGISLCEVPPASSRHSPCDEWTTHRLRVILGGFHDQGDGRNLGEFRGHARV